MKLYFVWGTEREYNRVLGGILFVAETLDACRNWVKENYPDDPMVNNDQFGRNENIGGQVSGCIMKADPEHNDWDEILLLFFMQMNRRNDA